MDIYSFIYVYVFSLYYDNNKFLHWIEIYLIKTKYYAAPNRLWALWKHVLIKMSAEWTLKRREVNDGYAGIVLYLTQIQQKKWSTFLWTPIARDTGHGFILLYVIVYGDLRSFIFFYKIIYILL